MVYLRERGRGERISVVLRLMARERARGKNERRMSLPSLVVGGGLYRVRHPLTSYVTKWGIDAVTSDDASTALSTVGLRISE
jgi:hypothetical protein